MAISLGQEGEEDGILSSINTTPLVDVMLVLLIIFLITIPVVTHSVPVALPKESNLPRQTKPENINISVTQGGKTYWNEQELASQGDLLARLKQVTLASGSPQPEVQVRGDADVPYEFVGRIVLACQRAGIVKVGFITEPPPRG